MTMKPRSVCAVVGFLWVLSIVVIGWSFVKGWTTPSTDGRTEILLAPSERDLILTEMRDLLKAVSGACVPATPSFSRAGVPRA